MMKKEEIVQKTIYRIDPLNTKRRPTTPKGNKYYSKKVPHIILLDGNKTDHIS
jgi:hypothetical protein